MGFAGLIRFLIILAVIYYGVRLITRFVLPFLVRYLFKKTQQNMHDQFGANQVHTEKEEGEVTIDKSKKKQDQQKIDEDAGEYIDFEEVD